MASNNTRWHNAAVTRTLREEQNGHRSIALWFTGLSGSGKSTIAHAVEEELHNRRIRTYVFDGDNVRHGLCSDLGFSKEDRTENVRRIAEMVKLFLDAGIVALTAFISPYREGRECVRRIVGEEHYIEIYCKCSLEVCESRDVKQLYKRARMGEIKEFTGISSPYEEPEQPDLILDSSKLSVEDCAGMVIALLEKHGITGTAGGRGRGIEPVTSGGKGG